MDLRPFLLSLVFYNTVWINNALRFLVFVPVYTKSHGILGHAVVDNLLDSGHEVVYVTSNPRRNRVSNLHEIDVRDISLRIMSQYRTHEQLQLKNVASQRTEPLYLITLIYELHKQIFEDAEIVSFFSDPKQKFDGVILEWILSNFIAGIAPLFRCPLIWLGTTEAHWQVLEIMDEISNPAFSADIFSLNSPPLSTWQRFEELWTIVKRSVQMRLYIIPGEKTVYSTSLKKIADRRGITLPPYEEAIYNGSLLLLNSHPSIGIAYRLPQNAKYIAGFHIHPDIKPLPEDLQTLMDSSKHGVIYFSMGTQVQSTDLSDFMKNSLLALFSKLRETVIWKFEGVIQNVPKNVYLVKWAPQQSILAHPNIKVFITHGGMLSTTEAVHFAVPIIGIPIMADQHLNMKLVINKGYGVKINFGENMATDLAHAIEEISSNPLYRQRVKELSIVYHDRPQTPQKEMVFWIEHVIKTNGAPHLRSPALSVRLYEKLYLDLIAMTVVTVYLIYTTVKRAIFKKNKKLKKLKSK